MNSLIKIKADLDIKFQRVLNTPAGFVFFQSIHDFIEHIEGHSSLSKSLSPNIKLNRDLRIPNKYISLKEIYQGLEDANTKSTADLGHNRYMILRELNRIRNNDLSENNPFWRKRELFRKLTGEVYQILNPGSSV